MHRSALRNARRFFGVYAKNLGNAVVVDIGSRDVNGSIHDVCPGRFKYIGVDFDVGDGVDVVLEDPYKLPFDDESVDIVVSSSCFEHSEFFWLQFLETMRILKPTGLFYLNAPSNGPFHRFPVDCWRFYPDSGKALVNWAIRNKYDAVLLESYTSRQYFDVFNDFVAVIAKDKAHAGLYPDRIVDASRDYYNGMKAGSETILRKANYPQDQRRALYWIKRKIWKMGNSMVDAMQRRSRGNR